MGKVQLKGNNPESKIMIKTLFKMFTKFGKVQPKEMILKHCQAKRVKHCKNVHKNRKSSTVGKQS